MKNLSDLKQYLKATAFAIKANKPLTKVNPDGKTNEEVAHHWSLYYEVKKMRIAFRLHLIAYCEIRGVLREKIETPAENNKPNEKEIERIKTEYAPVWRFSNETIHTGA